MRVSRGVAGGVSGRCCDVFELRTVRQGRKHTQLGQPILYDLASRSCKRRLGRAPTTRSCDSLQTCFEDFFL